MNLIEAMARSHVHLETDLYEPDQALEDKREEQSSILPFLHQMQELGAGLSFFHFTLKAVLLINHDK